MDRRRRDTPHRSTPIPLIIALPPLPPLFRRTPDRHPTVFFCPEEKSEKAEPQPKDTQTISNPTSDPGPEPATRYRPNAPDIPGAQDTPRKNGKTGGPAPLRGSIARCREHLRQRMASCFSSHIIVRSGDVAKGKTRKSEKGQRKRHAARTRRRGRTAKEHGRSRRDVRHPAERVRC